MKRISLLMLFLMAASLIVSAQSRFPLLDKSPMDMAIIL